MQFIKTLIFVFIVISVYNVFAKVESSSQVEKITYFCSIDSSYQPAMFYRPQSEEDTPLLVGLHPWSSDYTNSQGEKYSAFCIDSGWTYVFPNFRGGNNNPLATGSDFVIQDIIDAVKFCKENYNIDTSRIYLVGASGGGHAALLMAGKSPNTWAGISAWVPITDLQQWYTESKNMGTNYWTDISKSCGGNPLIDSLAILESKKRSPINYLHNAKNISIDINAGIYDGHSGELVPISHSLLAFNELALLTDTLSLEDINFFVAGKYVPFHLQDEKEDDPLYGSKKVLFRRKSNNARITIFDGKHEIIYEPAIAWLSKQSKLLTNIKNNKHEKSNLSFKLNQNYPNPFNPTTTICYDLPEAGEVKIQIYDIMGSLVEELVNSNQNAGSHSVIWNGRNSHGVQTASGIYLYKVQFNDQIKTAKMIFMK